MRRNFLASLTKMRMISKFRNCGHRRLIDQVGMNQNELIFVFQNLADNPSFVPKTDPPENSRFTAVVLLK
jgi:hypothetical protein